MFALKILAGYTVLYLVTFGIAYKIFVDDME